MFITIMTGIEIKTMIPKNNKFVFNDSSSFAVNIPDKKSGNHAMKL